MIYDYNEDPDSYEIYDEETFNTFTIDPKEGQRIVFKVSQFNIDFSPYIVPDLFNQLKQIILRADETRYSWFIDGRYEEESLKMPND